MNVELLGEELANIADEERQIEEMNYERLSAPDAVDCWFRDPCYDLCELGKTEIERFYLEQIDEVATRTGATNFFLADYIWRLEKRLVRIEQNLKG